MRWEQGEKNESIFGPLHLGTGVAAQHISHFTSHNVDNMLMLDKHRVSLSSIYEYSQKTFSLSVLSLIPLWTWSLLALQTKFFPLSCRVGVKSNVDVVMLPSMLVWGIVENERERMNEFFLKDLKLSRVVDSLLLHLPWMAARLMRRRSSTMWSLRAAESQWPHTQFHIVYLLITADYWTEFLHATVSLVWKKETISYVIYFFAWLEQKSEEYTEYTENWTWIFNSQCNSIVKFADTTFPGKLLAWHVKIACWCMRDKFLIASLLDALDG